jgi:hypothetical protein
MPEPHGTAGRFHERPIGKLPVHSRIASEAGKQAYKLGYSQPSGVLSFGTELIWHPNLLSRLLCWLAPATDTP